MTHPDVSEILAAAAGEGIPAELEHHLAICSACRELAGLAATEDAIAERSNDKDLADLPTIDRRLYNGWKELADGRGGMGRTLQARDRRLGREVAIKEPLDPVALPPAFREAARIRFEREARLTARLQHPAIVNIYEGGRWDDGEPFYAMPLVRGRPLGEEIDACQTFAQRLALLPRMTTVAEAIAYAHSEGIVHRDIKPQNVLIGPFGETIVIDWGLATDLRAEDTAEPLQDSPDAPDFGFTKLGVGTPSYMPPEQAEGAPPDPRMDVYAMGATLYHVLSGTPPYGYGPTNLVREKLRAGPPIPLVELARDAPPEIRAIVTKAMARDPADRFQSARELADDLQRFQTGQLTHTHLYTSGELLRLWMRRHRAVLRVAAVFTSALIILGILAIVRIMQERDHAKRELERSRGITASSLAPNPLERINAIELGIQAVAPRARAGHAPLPEALQGLVDALSAGPAAIRLDARSGSIVAFEMTPDGSTLVSLGTDGFIRFWDPQNGKQLRAPNTSKLGLYNLHISPDGTWLAACGYQVAEAELWNIASGEKRILPSHGPVARCLFSHDAANLFTADRKEVVRWDPKTATPIDRLPMESVPTDLALSTQGLVAVGTNAGTIHVWNPKTKQHVRLEGHHREVTSVQFTDDGTSLWSGGIDGRVLQWPVDFDASVHPTVIAEDPTVQVRNVHVATNGQYAYWGMGEPNHWSLAVLDFQHQRRVCHLQDMSYFVVPVSNASHTHWLASVSREGSLQIWDVHDCAPILGVNTPESPAFAGIPIEDVPRHQRLAWAGSGNALLWDLREGVATGLLLGHTSDIVTTHVSPKGDRFVTASMDGTARIWDLHRGDMLAILRSPAELVHAQFSPDGARIITAGLDGVAQLFDANGQWLDTLGEPGEPLSTALFSPNGQYVVTASFDGTAKLWNVSTGALERTLDTGDGSVHAAAFSPDGTTVFTACANRSVRRWNVATGKLEATLTSPNPETEYGVGSLFVSADSTLVFLGMTQKSMLLRSADLEHVADVAGHCASAMTSPFLADGRHLLVVDGDGRAVLSEIGSNDKRIFTGHSKLILSAQISEDGKRLVTGSMDGIVRVWHVEQQTTAFTIHAPELGQVTSAIPSPDGRWIITAYSSGALRLHPATAESALDRACAILTNLGRRDEMAKDCP